jgi:hypothetical protein
MSDDIVERLREPIIADALEEGRITDMCLAHRLVRDRHDASDEIERLRDQLWYLKGQLEVIADSEPCSAECGFPGYARALLKKECKDD